MGASEDQTASGRVLVVEDDPLQRRAVVRLLHLWGYDAVEAADGGAALDRYREIHDQLDAMLLDIMLPVLNGVDVAREVSASDPELPIIACSAAFDESIESELRDLGVSDFLRKPYDAESLHATLARQITRDEG